MDAIALLGVSHEPVDFEAGALIRALWEASSPWRLASKRPMNFLTVGTHEAMLARRLRSHWRARRLIVGQDIHRLLLEITSSSLAVGS